MDFEILHGFIKQIEEALPSIRGGVLTGARTGNRCGELETNLGQTVASNQTFDREQSEMLLDKLSALESSIARVRSEADSSPKIVSEPFEVDKTAHKFEIDETMLEIFAHEAADLTAVISTNLKILENFPGDRSALLEVRRSAHTLKGSAAIVGLEPLAQITHRVEDLLDYLSENPAESGKNYLQLLLSAVDCFAPLSRGENSPRLTSKIADFYRHFDRATACLPLAGKDCVSVSAPETNEKAAPASFKNRSSLIRVSLLKLDGLINTTSELTGASARFEKRLAEMERHIAELRGSALDYTDGNRRENDLLELGDAADFFPGASGTGENHGGISAVAGKLNRVKQDFVTFFADQHRSIEQLHAELLSLRKIRFGSISARLNRAVSLACEEEEKFADLFIDDENFELDTQVLDCLVEPLLHLLRNAVAHGVEAPELRGLSGKPETGKISLTIRQDKTDVVVTVADDGRGISADALVETAIEGGFISRAEAEKMSRREVFELVFLPGLTTAEKLTQVSGRGIGMNAVKSGIEQHGGSVSISSESREGTAFSLRLPATLPNAQATNGKQKEEIKSVLIVDDSRSVRRAAVELIENAGWKASVARDGIEAFEVLHNGDEPPNLIITDAEMPRMDGYEFLKALKELEHLSGIPVVMLSSRADDWHRREAFECGADEYLTKPFENSFLLDRIEKLAKSS